jgi:hypothetical protein
MEVEVAMAADSQDQMMMSDEQLGSSGGPSKTQVVTITTPNIINGKIKRIQVNNDKFHKVNLNFELDAEDDQAGSAPSRGMGGA